MTTVPDITDSSQWHRRDMQTFEDNMRCPICHDFLTTAMILKGCGHTCTCTCPSPHPIAVVCSVCIRRHFGTHQDCPICHHVRVHPQRGHDMSQDSSPSCIFNSRMHDEIVRQYQALRPELMASLKPLQDELDRAVVECPLCLGPFARAVVESHASACKGRPPALKPLPKPVFHLLKDSQLKGRLAELRLPTTGDREIQIRRLSEYITLYNAECDSLRPRPLSLIRKEVDRLEKSRSARPPESSPLDDSEYRKRHADHFRDLVARTRRK